MMESTWRAAAFLMAGLPLLGISGSALAADPAAGKAVFTSQCGICHSVVSGKNGVGPSLFGIVGRKTGGVPGFHYSPANQNANIEWNEQTLEQYLKAPMTTIPGTTMGYAGVKDDVQRANLVAYIGTLK
jgi:cytochrome c